MIIEQYLLLTLTCAFLLLSPCHALAQVPLSESRATLTSSLSAEQLKVDQSSDSWKEGGTVSVRITKNITFVSPSEAIDAWLEHHWKKGGGLPIFVTRSEDDTTLKRVIYPVAMEESISLPIEATKSQDIVTFLYHVSKPGPFFASDLVPNSHQGTVTISSNDRTMTWEVGFETTRFRRLYQLFTEFTVGVAARTVEEALQPSQLLTLQATIPRGEVAEDAVTNVRRAFLEFFWARGGGLPLPPPIPYGELLSEGGGAARTKLLRIPPLITESIVSNDYEYASSDKRADIVYQLEQPGWTTFPFLIHTHLGRIQLLQSETNENNVDMLWQVEIRPWPIVAPIVKKLMEMTISTITRNFIVHMSEPGATVELRPPRGSADLTGGNSSFGSVPKDSWLGGVMDAHLQDKRSTLDQALSLLRPWTWGRSGDRGDTDGMVTFAWSEEGSIEF